LAVEAGDGIADGVVEVAASFDLEAREDGDDFAIGFDDLRGDGAALAILERNSKSVVSPRSSSRYAPWVISSA
jgi:hypothetical protein